MHRIKCGTLFIFIFLFFCGEMNTSESFSVNNRIAPPNFNKLLSRIKRQLESGSSTTDRRYKLFGETTDDGIMYVGGFDLPKDFKGSGTSDFAFDGPSFRRWTPFENKFENNEVTSESPDWYFPDEWKKMQEKMRAESQNKKIANNILPVSTTESTTSQSSVSDYPPSIPSPCEFNCHRLYVTTEYDPVCGSNGVTYANSGKFRCAQKCGRNITGRHHFTCGRRGPRV